MNNYSNYAKAKQNKNTILGKEAISVSKRVTKTEGMTKTKMRPALSPEARENQLVSLAVDLAEKQLMEGTASSQVITHYLKLASSKEKLELEKMRKEIEMTEAKTQNLQSAKRVEELYANALKAMRDYSGDGGVNYED